MNEFIENNSYVKNMNEYVKKKKIKNYGFEEELKELIKSLSRFKKNNTLLIGKAGVGKTALVEKLCEEINEGNIPENLKNKTILEVSLNASIAGTKYRGMFEEKVQQLIEFVTENQNVILFIDEVHNLIKCNANDSNINLGEILKPYLARGEVTLIGATTIEEYSMSIAGDRAMNRRFNKIEVNEPSIDKVKIILEKSKTAYENHYKIKLSKRDIDKVIKLSKDKTGSFPDKAFDVLEDYCYEKYEELENDKR